MQHALHKRNTLGTMRPSEALSLHRIRIRELALSRRDVSRFKPF
jgi:hypothetical protein